MRAELPEQVGQDDLRLLVSDIDGTLLDEGASTAGLTSLRLLLDAYGAAIRLVYATGRSYGSTRRLVDEGILPQPAAVAAFVGTELWLPPWKAPDPTYERTVIAGWDRERVGRVMAGFDDLEPQPDEFQTPLKASYYLRDPERIEEVAEALRRAGLRFRLVYSGGELFDVLPAEAGKRRAIEHLQRRWGVKHTRVLAAGDSGNDLDMLSDPRYLAVAVGNAEAELQKLNGDTRVYVADLPHAAGVLEGVERYDFFDSER